MFTHRPGGRFLGTGEAAQGTAAAAIANATADAIGVRELPLTRKGIKLDWHLNTAF